MSYASGTAVTEDRSRAEIEKLLTKIGAARFAVMTDVEARKATIGFQFKNLRIEMSISLPNVNDKKFKHTPSGRWTVSEDRAYQEYLAEVRRRWRSLALALKAKMVAVDDGITTFEHEFLPYMIAADGQSVAAKLMPDVERAMAGGGLHVTMLPALPPGESK